MLFLRIGNYVLYSLFFVHACDRIAAMPVEWVYLCVLHLSLHLEQCYGRITPHKATRLFPLNYAGARGSSQPLQSQYGSSDGKLEAVCGS